jgi:excisionase family DNA binding protein
MSRPTETRSSAEAASHLPADHRDAIRIEGLHRRKAWSVAEACILTSLSRASIYDLINRGELKSVMIAGRRLIPDAAIDELIENALNREPREVA